MKKLLLPLLLGLVGAGGGIGAGLMLKPEPIAEELADGTPCGDVHQEEQPETAEDVIAEIPDEREYAKLNNQFVIPVVKDGHVESMVVMSMSLEVIPGERGAVFAVEPKLRDSFLQVMFDHANLGGFSGNFTSGTNMRSLRNELSRVARNVVGNTVTDVLITDIVRQDN